MKLKTILCTQQEFVIISSQKLGELRDKNNSKIDEIEKWVHEIIMQSESESKIKKKRCETCNSREEPNELEGHHVAGRKHDYRQITCCKTCHRLLSDRQKMWDRRWLLENQSQNLKTTFFLLGLQDILILKSKRTDCSLYEELGHLYTETISELLKVG